ncbi:tetratricopeptide repeat protein [Stieleria sp. TO1_6]|uniref:tetratricopeptide repeat protein n=1 Tax=Stieleria tagensis TaxID=2956795 RepID=UPI00209AB5A7|nr:tetratricopeptide repeat protein [Stieleria tagensis]MCO8121188.1 tetratricopeptide repeat protein [Stieleria tagensis]
MNESSSTLDAAIDCLQRGDLADAIAGFRQSISQQPDNARAWHLCGIAHARQNDLESAAECFTTAARLAPTNPNYHYNLGLAHQSLKQFDQSIAAYRRAIELKPDLVEAQTNLGNSLNESGQAAESIDHFRKMIELLPNESVGFYNLANVLQDNGNFAESITQFRRAIELDPDFSSARENLGRALSDVERYDEATEVWQQWLDHDPENAVARHMLASITGQGTPERCDDDYVRHTFDQDFANCYETQLARIQYRVPELIGRSIELLDTPFCDAQVLDAGCGTGLCAGVLRPLAERLIGVDLSADMLAQAERLACYDELHEDELTHFLDHCDRRFDLIVSGDTLCYFGRLDDVLSKAAQCLSPDGVLVFSVEQHDNEDQSFWLQPHGRYRHARPYIEQTIKQAGLTIVDLDTQTLRKERGRDVSGFIVTATANSNR